MSKRNFLGMALLCAVFAAMPLRAGNLPEQFKPRPDVTELLQLSGAANVAQKLAPLISEQFVEAFRQSSHIVPDREVTVINEVVVSYLDNPAHTRDLMEQVAQIYERTFSPLEIQQLIAFYKTPIGRKLTAALPAITNGTAQAGRVWADQMLPGLRETLLTRLRSEGLIPRS